MKILRGKKVDVGSLTQKLNADKYNRSVFRRLGNAYLVGGFIRDTIIGRHSVDRDYIVRDDPLNAAKETAILLGGTLVSFKNGSTMRVALKNGLTLDFSKIGADLQKDLMSRDFTFNSIAFNPLEGVIDPSDGIGDIEKRIIRTLNIQNLVDDPLRCLRAYRMKGEVGWGIEDLTKDMIKRTKKGIENVSYERITLEFFKLLNGNYYLEALYDCMKNSVLSEIISLNINTLKRNIDKLHEVENNIDKLPFKVKKRMDNLVSQNLTQKGAIRLEQLVHGCTFKDIRMAFSNHIVKRLIKSSNFLNDFLNREVKPIDIFDIFFSSKDMAYDIACLSGRVDLITMAKRFLYIEKTRLLTTDEIMRAAGLRGSNLGRLIYLLKKERFYKKIRTKKQAIRYLKNFRGFV